MKGDVGQPVCKRCNELSVVRTGETQYSDHVCLKPDVVLWFEVHDNVVLTTNYMGRNGYSAEAVAYCVEKPWKHEEEYKLAIAEQTFDNSFPPSGMT